MRERVRAHLSAKLSGCAPSPFPCLPLAVFTPLYLLSSEGSLLPALPKDLFTPRLTDSCLTLHCSPQIMAKYKEGGGKKKKNPAALPPRKNKKIHYVSAGAGRLLSRRRQRAEASADGSRGSVPTSVWLGHAHHVSSH